MKTIFVGNLPPDTTEDEVNQIFSEHGRVRSLRLVRDVFSGNCRGFGFVEMEGHEARAAISGLDGLDIRGNKIKVNEERPQKQRGGRRR